MERKLLRYVIHNWLFTMNVLAFVVVCGITLVLFAHVKMAKVKVGWFGTISVPMQGNQCKLVFTLFITEYLGVSRTQWLK